MGLTMVVPCQHPPAHVGLSPCDFAQLQQQQRMPISRRAWLALGIAAGLTGCLGGEKPLQVIENFYAAVAEGNTDKAVQYLALENVSANEMIAVKAKVAVMVAQGKAVIDANNGVQKVQVLEENLSEDGAQANVRVQVTFRNDKTDTDTFKLRKVNGHWKIRL